MTFLVWYSDVLHEVKPVDSGYRVVLTFNLIQTESSYRLSAGNDQTTSLRAALARWYDCPDPPFLICPLEHKYTATSLDLKRLKGNDSARVQSVAKLVEDGKFICYLASVEKEITGSVDDNYESGNISDIIDEIDSSIKLTRVVSLDGTEKLAKLPITSEDFVDDYEDFFDEDPDDEDFGGYTGNEGAETTQWYRKSVITIQSTLMWDRANIREGNGNCAPRTLHGPRYQTVLATSHR